MGADSAVQYLSLTLEVFLVDLLLSGDNAVVIALACRGLPDPQKRQGLVIGTAAAIALRIVLTLAAGLVLRAPFLRLLGGVALVGIAIRLAAEEEEAGVDQALSGRLQQPRTRVFSAVRTIVVADLVMSLDNVLALAAVAGSHVVVLALGLLLSVPLLMAGGWYLSSLFARFPSLVRLGGAMLGWFAGDIAVSDAVYVAWVDQQSPALRVVVPALCALYVVLQAEIVSRARASAEALRPAPAETSSAGATSFVDDATRGLDRSTVALSTTPAVPDLVADRDSNDADTDQAPQRRGPGLRRAIAIAALVLLVGIGYWAVTRRWMPVPATLARYDCSNNTTLYYAPGGQRIAVSTGQNVANGVILANNQIDWGDYHGTSMKLGTVPPTRVVFATAQTLRVEGGFFNGVTCSAR